MPGPAGPPTATCGANNKYTAVKTGSCVPYQGADGLTWQGVLHKLHELADTLILPYFKGKPKAVHT